MTEENTVPKIEVISIDSMKKKISEDEEAMRSSEILKSRADANLCQLNIEAARANYQLLFKNKVPRNKKNNLEWFQSLHL